jgi:hypothetical protein
MPRSRSAAPRRSSLGRYTHRVAIANSRIRACGDDHVAFVWKDYRHQGAVKVMRLAPDEFIRRFLLHALPDGFRRIRHFGYFANGRRTERLALCRALLTKEGGPAAIGEEAPPKPEPGDATGSVSPPCSECGGLMRRVERVPRSGQWPRRDTSPFRCDTS